MAYCLIKITWSNRILLCNCGCGYFKAAVKRALWNATLAPLFVRPCAVRIPRLKTTPFYRFIRVSRRELEADLALFWSRLLSFLLSFLQVRDPYGLVEAEGTMQQSGEQVFAPEHCRFSSSVMLDPPIWCLSEGNEGIFVNRALYGGNWHEMLRAFNSAQYA
jgi:hypothetical protein